MAYFPLPPGVPADPIESVTNPPSYNSSTSDAPPPAYFPTLSSPSPQPPVYTSPGQPNLDANSHWARFPSSIPTRPTAQRPSAPWRISGTDVTRNRPFWRAPPGYTTGSLKPAPKRYRSSTLLRPDFRTNGHNDAGSSDSQPFPFPYNPYGPPSPSPCPPTHQSPGRTSLNASVESDLEIDVERRTQRTPGPERHYNMPADENHLLIGCGGKYEGSQSYGNGGWYGRNSAAAWCFFLALLIAVIVISAVVFRLKAERG